MKIKRRIFTFLLIILLVSNSVICFAGMKSKVYDSNACQVKIKAFVNREAAPLFDYNSWRYVVYNVDSEAFTHNVQFRYYKKKRSEEYECVYKKKGLREFDPRGKGHEVLNYTKNVYNISLFVDGSSLRFELHSDIKDK